MAIPGQLLTGPAVTASLDAIASLRIDIFREFPYLLYDGHREDELNYLQTYWISETTDPRDIDA